MDGLNMFLYMFLGVLGFMSLIVGIWHFFIYAKLSWARRNNSKSYNGIETSEAIFNKLGDDIKVKSSFWSLTYVRYSKLTRTLKLGRIDSRRKSLWTVATSGRQAYSAHIIEKASRGERPPISLFWFKLQTFWFNFIFSMILNIGVFVSLGFWISNIDGSDSSSIFNLWFWVFLAIILLVPLLYSLASFKTSRLMINNINNIFDGIFNEQEVNKIRQLWKLEYINSIIELIRTTLLIIISLLKVIFTSQKNK